MKRFLFFIVACVAYCHTAFCQAPVVPPGVEPPGVVIPWQAYPIFDPINGSIPTPKTPIQYPLVSIDGHTLYLYGVDFDLTLQLVDENDDVVYTVFVPANTASVVLPGTFTGEFELQLIPTTGIYYFVSDITL